MQDRALQEALHASRGNRCQVKARCSQEGDMGFKSWPNMLLLQACVQSPQRMLSYGWTSGQG